MKKWQIIVSLVLGFVIGMGWMLYWPIDSVQESWTIPVLYGAMFLLLGFFGVINHVRGRN